MDFWKVLEIIGERYPQWAPILTRPGIFDVLSRAINETWDLSRIFTALQNTEYFKTTSDSERAWDVLATTNPGEAKAKTQEADRMVRRVQLQLGLPSSNDFDAFALAAQAAQQGWDEGRTRMEVVARSNGASYHGPGGIGDTMNQYRGLAEDYGVRLNGDELYWWAANAGGSVSEQGFRDNVTRHAMNLYPVLAQPLSEGQSVRDFATSYLNQAASELGINPNSISLLDPKWVGTFLGSNDKGEQTVLNMNESLQKIRTDPALGYDQGLPGRTEAARLATTIRQEWGMAA